MTATDVPVVLVLLLPGFLAIEVFGLVTFRSVRLPDLSTLLWSLFFSFVLLAPTAALWHKADATYPSFGQVVTNPKVLPMRLALTLYLIAVPFEYGVGALVQSRRVETALARSLKWLNVDLMGRYDVWHLAFRDSYYIIVHLKSGRIVYGFPEKTETDRRGGVCDIYLVNTRIWDAEKEDWIEQNDVEGVWVDATNVDRIDFTRRAKPPRQPAKTTSSADTSRI